MKIELDLDLRIRDVYISVRVGGKTAFGKTVIGKNLYSHKYEI